MRLKKGPPDFVLFLTTMALVGVGLVMVFSASAVTSSVRYDDAYYYLKKQILWVPIGLVFMVVLMKFNFLRLKSLAMPAMIVAFLCLILVISPVGTVVNGSSRWLVFGPFRFSPSELAKIAMVLFMAKSLDNNIDQIRSFKNGVLPYLLVLAVVCGLIMLQPDLGTSIVIAGTVFLLLVVAGGKASQLWGLIACGVGAVVAAIAVAPYRLDRVVSWLDPFKYAADEGFQTVQSLYALGSGGLFGMGLGRSRQKFFYLPEQHTDFIFAIIGEELGFIGVCLIILLFLLFAWRGFKIAMNAPDTFSSLLAAGLTIMIILQAGVNIGVVSGALPVTGITLPFISYGGTSLLFSMSAVGLLLNISRYSVD